MRLSRGTVTFAVLALSLLGLAACTSSGTAPNPPVPSAVRATTIAFSNGGPAPSDEIVTVPATASGATAATTELAGTTTTLSDPIGLSFDASEDLWVANYVGHGVLEFAKGATGDVAPITTISGGSTTLSLPCGLTDVSGDVYVADYSDAVDVWDNPSGTVTSAPNVRITSASLLNPCGIAVDAKGNIWVSNYGSTTVVEFSSGASGSSTPTNTLSGFLAPVGMAFDSGGDLWVADSGGNDVLEFAKGATTGASPIDTITGVTDVTGVAVDAKGYIYAVEEAGTVLVFAPGASGAATPVQTITVSSMANGWGIAVH